MLAYHGHPLALSRVHVCLSSDLPFSLLARRHLHERRRCDADDLTSRSRRAARLAHRIDRHMVVCARGRRVDELLTNHLIEQLVLPLSVCGTARNTSAARAA